MTRGEEGDVEYDLVLAENHVLLVVCHTHTHLDVIDLQSSIDTSPTKSCQYQDEVLFFFLLLKLICTCPERTDLRPSLSL